MTTDQATADMIRYQTLAIGHSLFYLTGQ